MRFEQSGVRRARRIVPALLPLLVLAGAVLTASNAAAQTSLEYQVKAAFLLNFTKFIEWPSSAFAGSDSPINICILGKDPFRTVLDDLVQGEVVGGHKVAVKIIKEPPAPHACQLLFVEDAKDFPKPLADPGSGVLTIGEGPDFIHQGGAIAFIIENRRVRFDINQSAAENAGLKLSSKLLTVARRVEK